MREAKSFCRFCGAGCGVILTIENDRIVKIRGDKDNPVSAGYACFKGLQADEAHRTSKRILHPLKRGKDGRFEQISLERALDEIADKLGHLHQTYPPDTIALFKGTGSIATTTARTIHRDFLKALGTRSYYSTFTIDQSAKQITGDRLGQWHAGKDHIDQSDVIMLFGTNPLVSHSTMGLFVSDPVKRMKKARARGMKLIIIDPRRTETAAFADIVLQPIAGEDATIAAGMLRLILSEGLHDKDFCEKYVDDLNSLEKLVEPFTPEYVSQRTGISSEALTAAVRMFAGPGKRGAAYSGTGPDMAARSNLTEHLIECLNVVCGRYKRAGDIMPNPDLLSTAQTWRAEVIPPTRSWERKGDGRIRGANWFFGEKLSATLADEILTPGETQVRALIVDGGNPASVLPDKAKVTRAFNELDLLVAIEPYMTDTARQAHYILPPKLPYERPDVPMSFPGMSFFADGWAQYTPAIVPPPADSELVDDWYVFWSLAKRMGLKLTYAGVPLDMENPPISEELIPLGFAQACVPFEKIRQHSSGYRLQPEEMPVVQPPQDGSIAQFDVAPDDIRQAVAEVVKEDIKSQNAKFSHRLISRRMRDVNNTSGLDIDAIRARTPYNPAYLHPDDIAALGLKPGQRARITSDNGTILCVVEADDTLRVGNISMCHGWGAPDPEADPAISGSSTNYLIADDRDIEPINAMVRMSAIPVTISAFRG